MLYCIFNRMMSNPFGVISLNTTSITFEGIQLFISRIDEMCKYLLPYYWCILLAVEQKKKKNRLTNNLITTYLNLVM